MRTGLSILVVFALGCGGASASHATQSTETASTSGAESAAPARPRATGSWTVGGQSFAPDVALAYAGPDGSYEVLLASPAVSCDFARNGGDVPANLRTIAVHALVWQPGAAVPSSGGDFTGQVAFGYDDPDTGTHNFLGNGTVTPGQAPTAASVGTIQIAAGDGDSPPANGADGEIDVTLCP